MEAAGKTLATDLGREQEGALDACRIHLFEVLLEANACHVGLGFHLPGEELLLPARPKGQSLLGPDAGNDVDRGNGRHGGYGHGRDS